MSSQTVGVLRHYLNEIEKTYRAGNATEHTYRSDLKGLLKQLFPDVTATNEPKRIKCGAPDFILTRNLTPLGYIETKDIGISLDQVERTDQMKRYLGSLGNLILTNYVVFRWYVAGEYRMTACLTKGGAKGKWIPEPDGIDQVSNLLQGFILTAAPTVSNPKELAIRMAGLAQLIRDTITRAFKSEEGGGSLHIQMEGFRQVLLPDLTPEQFADMYAQTICYGLFAARCITRPNVSFTREYAAFNMPKTNPFLSKMFAHIAGPDLDERVVWVVDDLAEVLNRSDMRAILQDFGKRTRQEDPVVHFYETFLAQYDPKMREARGVYYTPEPVVSYIVRSIDHLLKHDFDLSDGLADTTTLKATSSDGKYSMETHLVQILDPATGTGTFLHSVIDLIYESFQNNKGMWSSYVSQHLLKRLFGFELLMAPYAVAHMKLGLQLAETGYDFRSNERLGVYLTNTLEESFEGGKLPFAEWLFKEATEAGKVKHDLPIMIVIGNPPYSKASYNRSEWIEKLMRDYKVTVRREESQIQGLSNDYIKFIRFAQWRIDRTQNGILGFITGHGYINGPQARDMRASLLQSFDKIFILNLHGSVRRLTELKDDERDDPVFNIQQGTAIIIAIKGIGGSNIVHYADLKGTLKSKIDYLKNNDISSTCWIDVSPQPPNYFFVPQDLESLDLEKEYNSFPSLPEIYGTGNRQADKEKLWATGFASQQDEFAISFDRAEIEEKITKLLSSESEDELREYYRLCTTDQWSYSRAKKALKTGLWRSNISICAYRPFDPRWTVFDRNIVSILRSAVMEQMQDTDNLALISSRVVNDSTFAHVFVSKYPVDKIFLSGKTSTNAYIFPLNHYQSTPKDSLFTLNDSDNALKKIQPNLASKFVEDFAQKLRLEFTSTGEGGIQKTFGPVDIFHYMYAIFHSPTYRTRYADFLKIDFPRLPLTSNPDLFRTLCELGDRLVRLHLLKKFGKTMPIYPVGGDHSVEKVEYSAPEDQPDQGRVYINKTEYFEGIPPEVWEFHVGGYQVCHKWLKDRKGRTLSYDDIQHYQRIVAALAETICLMEQIDEVIEEHGGWPIE